MSRLSRIGRIRRFVGTFFIDPLSVKELSGIARRWQTYVGRGVYIALSIDGTKKSGRTVCDLPIPEGLFETEVFVNCGRSMLRCFQMGGQTLDGEIVADRLLLTY